MAKRDNLWDSAPLDMTEVSDTMERRWQEFVEIWQSAFDTSTADDTGDEDEADGLDEYEDEPDYDDGDADSDE